MTANPKGRPRGTQSFVDRAKHWLETMTVQDIDDLMSDLKASRKLGAYDFMILKRIHEAIQPGGRNSMNDLLDRIIGKPVQPVAQKVEHSIKDPLAAGAMKEIRALPDDALKAMREIMDKYSPPPTIEDFAELGRITRGE